MRVALFTTDTPHHLYYAWQMKIGGMLDSVVIESSRLQPPFPTEHPFEHERDRHEREVLLAGGPASFDELGTVVRCQSVSSAATAGELTALKPDVVIVFGTGRLTESSTVARVACLNLHGGNPEEYRGLDSHLWTIYHRDFDNLITTLHYLSPELDAGDIVFSSSLPIPRDTSLSHLRAINTKVCVELSRMAVRLLADDFSLPRRPQLRRGRYYSAMPAVLKEDCVQKFARWSASR